jgi:DNA-binding NarL/FixJ family response regulator
VAIRIVLAEDSYLVREGVRRLLETQPDLEVAATNSARSTSRSTPRKALTGAPSDS